MHDMPVKPIGMASQKMTSTQPLDRNTPSDPASFGQWLSKSIQAVEKMQQEGGGKI